MPPSKVPDAQRRQTSAMAHYHLWQALHTHVMLRESPPIKQLETEASWDPVA